MTLNLLKKIAMSALVAGLALMSPVIIVYSVPFGFGIVSDIVRLGYAPMAAGLVVSVMLLRRAYRTEKLAAA
jgi:hypothetical protein